MKLKILPRAQAQARSKRVWWVENRPDAPTLFDEEFGRVLELLRETPGAGASWPTARNPAIRRVLMTRTRSHVYFYLEERSGVVMVLAVWGAARGRGPRL